MSSLLCVCFFLLVFQSCRPKPNDAFVVTVEPDGEMIDERQMVIHFSRNMVRQEKVGKTDHLPLTFSPKIEGEARWRDEKTLVFMPSKSLPPSTRFTVTVPGKTTALDGNRLITDHTFTFYTTQITGELVLLGQAEYAEKRPVFRVSFTQPVAVETIKEKCRFKHDTKTVGVAIEPGQDAGPAKSYRLLPASDLALNSAWTLTCRAGLTGVVGNLGIEQTLGFDFRTYGPLRFEKMEPSGSDVVPSEDLRFAIAFSNPVAKPYRLTIAPAVPGFPENCHMLDEEHPGLDCGAMLEAHTDYTVTIDAGQKDIFGQTLGKTRTETFHTTDAEPTVSMESGYFVAELKRPVLPVWTRNVSALDLTAVRVTPENFYKVSELIDWWDTTPADFTTSGLKRQARTIPITSKRNQWHQHPLDPAALFGMRRGPGMYYLEVGAKEATRSPFHDGGREKVLVNFTDIGVVAKLSPIRGLIWTTRLSTGTPLSGAKVHVRNYKGDITWKGATDHNGMVYLPPRKTLFGHRADAKTPSSEDDESEAMDEEADASRLDVFVQDGDDWTMVNALRTGRLDASNFDNVFRDYSTAPLKLRGFLHTDRGLYRPGDTVHLKGLARETRLGQHLAVPTEKRGTVKIYDPRDAVIEEREISLSRFGGFWLDLTLPEDARLGNYAVVAELEHGTFRSQFVVEEFRPATFEVSGKADTSRLVRRGTLKADVLARYLYGAPLREGDVTVSVHSRPRTVQFKQLEGFNFSDWLDEESYHAAYGSQALITEAALSLDENGHAEATVDITPDDIPGDADLLVQASVTSPANERITKSFTVPYFSARRYFGIKKTAYTWETGAPYPFEVVAVKPNGAPAKCSTDVTVKRRSYNCVWEEWGYRGSYRCSEEEETVFAETVAFEGKPVQLSFTPKKGGDYWIVVDGKRGAGKSASENVYVWGEGSGYKVEDRMTFDVIPDKETYHAGDTAKLILKTDLAKGKGLVTIERGGIIETRFIEVDHETKHIDVPVDEGYAPNVYVSIVLVQGRLGEGRRGKPRLRMGMANLAVQPKDHTLRLSIETDKKDYRPGDSVTATLKITDANGNPVVAEAAVTAADEGVLSLIGFRTPDPIPTFYAPFGLGIDTTSQYAYIRDIPGPNLERPATGGDSAGPGSARSRFLASLVWKPGIVTNDNGIASVTFDAPDNLTAFRMMAVAADAGHRFGSGDGRFTVSKPLQLHPFLPRFLTQKDRFFGGVVVHNETDADGEVIVTLTPDAALSVAGPLTQRVRVARGSTAKVVYDMTAKQLGDTRLAFSATMPGYRDAVVFTLPVHHPSPTVKASVANGAVTDSAEMVLELPKNVLPGSAEVSVSVDPDGLSGIEEGLQDLIGYPYGCLEQTTSKVIPMLTVGRLVEMLDLKHFSEDALNRYIKAGIAKIGRHQTYTGGFSLWPGGESETYYTAFALFGLYWAKTSGFEVDASRIKDGLEYLRYKGKEPRTDRPYYSEAGYLGNQAFAFYVRALLGDNDTAGATRLLEKSDHMPLFGQAFLLQALVLGLGRDDPAVKKLAATLTACITRAVEGKTLIEEPDQANLDWYMSSAIRTTAAVLDAVLVATPDLPALKPLARLLLEKRRASRYLSTQENLYSLLALSNVAASLSRESPAITVALNDHTLIDGPLKGENRMRIASAAVKGGETLAFRSTGEAFYNVQLRYRERPETIRPIANHLIIERDYLDQDGAVKTAFKVRDLVRVRLIVPLEESASHLMISDRIPAGFEIINTRFVTTASTDAAERRAYGSYRENRDERVDFSTEYCWSRSQVFEYTLRAIMPGTFVLPPASAELMYEPDIRARTGLGTITVTAEP